MKNKLLYLLLLLPLFAHAQDSLYAQRQYIEVDPSKPVITNVQYVGVGYANLLDTYLSQEEYGGIEVRYISHTTRENNSRWSSECIHQGLIQNVSPRSDDNRETGGMYTFDYVRHYQLIPFNGKWSLKVGGMAEAGVGFLYNTRNSNNPAQARLYLHLSPNIVGTYQFSLFNKQFTARYELSAPLLGVMFSPNYGQSYYEIFSRGNYDHNAVFTTPFNAPTLRHQLSVDFSLGKATFRLGYLGDYQQAKVNGLKYHTNSHLLLIGYVHKFQIFDVK